MSPISAIYKALSLHASQAAATAHFATQAVGEFADQVIDRHISTHLILLPRNPLVRREREDRLAIPLLLLYLEAVSS